MADGLLLDDDQLDAGLDDRLFSSLSLDDAQRERQNALDAASDAPLPAEAIAAPPTPQRATYEPDAEVEIVELPFANMKDGECVLVGGAPTQYRFRLRLGGSLAGADGPLLAAYLVSQTQKEGRWVERVIEDGLKGAVPVAFAHGEAAMRLCLCSAGRGAPWRVRFVVSDASTGRALCSCDLPVRAFSKRHKVDAVLASPESLESALGARGATGGSQTASPVRQKMPQTPLEAPTPAAAAPQAQAQRHTLAAILAAPAAAAAASATPKQESWLEVVAAEIAPALRGAAGAALADARPLQRGDVEYITRALAVLPSAEAARTWMARTFAEVAKLPRLWASSNPRLIAGFVQKEFAEETLRGRAPGTFMLRWSSGEPGELVIAYVMENGSVDHCYVRSDGEVLDETVLVERVLSAPRLKLVFDPESGIIAQKDVYRLRGRYSHSLSQL